MINGKQRGAEGELHHLNAIHKSIASQFKYSSSRDHQLRSSITSSNSRVYVNSPHWSLEDHPNLLHFPLAVMKADESALTNRVNINPAKSETDLSRFARKWTMKCVFNGNEMVSIQRNCFVSLIIPICTSFRFKSESRSPPPSPPQPLLVPGNPPWTVAFGFVGRCERNIYGLSHSN